MIVDDEDLVRTSLSDMLELAGYQVCGQAPNGYEATRLANSARPDIILIDLVMPVMDGVEALEIINATQPSCALVLSAYCSPSLLEKVSAAGAQGYLMKPCRQADLVPAIETAIAQFRRCRTAIDGERIAGLFDAAWSTIERGASPGPAAERALAAACHLAGHTAFALVMRRGARLQALCARGLTHITRGTFVGPANGPLGRALRAKTLCQHRLVGAPAHATSVLSVPLLMGETFEGCLCLFAPDGHRFSRQEERLVGAAGRALAGLLQRLQSERPHSWSRWLSPETRRTRVLRRRS